MPVSISESLEVSEPFDRYLAAVSEAFLAERPTLAEPAFAALCRSINPWDGDPTRFPFFRALHTLWFSVTVSVLHDATVIPLSILETWISEDYRFFARRPAKWMAAMYVNPAFAADFGSGRFEALIRDPEARRIHEEFVVDLLVPYKDLHASYFEHAVENGTPTPRDLVERPLREVVASLKGLSPNFTDFDGERFFEWWMDVLRERRILTYDLSAFVRDFYRSAVFLHHIRNTRNYVVVFEAVYIPSFVFRIEPGLVAYAQVALSISAFCMALKLSLAISEVTYQIDPSVVAHMARSLRSTFSEEEIAAIERRIKACRDRFIVEGDGPQRRQCLCRVLTDVLEANGGTLPFEIWDEIYDKLGCAVAH